MKKISLWFYVISVALFLTIYYLSCLTIDEGGKDKKSTNPVCGNFKCETGEAEKICPQDCKYKDNGNGTITDNTTGLLWLKCSLGQSLTSEDCSGDAAAYKYCPTQDNTCNGGTTGGILDSGTLYDACNSLNSMSFGGKFNWRVPTNDELYTLVQTGLSWIIDPHYFPNTAKKGMEVVYWSSSSHESDAGLAWIVIFNGGYVGGDYKNNDKYVRCVASGL